MLSGRQIGGITVRKKSKFQIPYTVARNWTKEKYFVLYEFCTRTRRTGEDAYIWHRSTAALRSGDATEI
jgi:hypothetical protein